MLGVAEATFAVRTQAGARRDEIVGVRDGVLIVRVSAPAREGRRHRLHVDGETLVFQSTPPREGRPALTMSDGSTFVGFNPRPRARGDAIALSWTAPNECFSPPPREGRLRFSGSEP